MVSLQPTTSGADSKGRFRIDPPLLNSANPWATTYDDLASLYDCPDTGAVTIRTCLWKEFEQDPQKHQYTFFSSTKGHATATINTNLPEGRGEVRPGETSSLNTLGYSPIPFIGYMKVLKQMSQAGALTRSPAKPFIVSVTGTAFQVVACYTHLLELQNRPESFRWNPEGKYDDLLLMMEINLSCPNILDEPPPAYDGERLGEYITALAEAKQIFSGGYREPLLVGIKTPPYTYQGQFQTLIHALEESAKLEGGCPVSFITATNTLGSCLVVNERNEPALGSANGMGIGGMAGDALHPLALGNVKTIRAMLDASEYPDLHQIAIIGVGGVNDAAGFKRMQSVGAAAVGVGTALGREGVSIFSKISEGLLKAGI